MSNNLLRDTEGRIILKEHSPKDIATCNVCCARNYDSHITPEIGKKVNRLYDVMIGRHCLQQITLCGLCITSLYKALDHFIALAGNDEIEVKIPS